ncbi:caspase domain-containing protein [Phormidesmis sp. 146-35]
MTNHWAVAVGIDHYQFLQPLQFAQQDAQELCECLVSEAGFLPDRCLLFTDTSPEVLNRSTYPSRGNLQGWLDYLKKDLVQPDDWLWVFFSGYGVCCQGQDYLMPIEADPVNVPETGIPLRSLYDSLKNLPTDRILVLLDVNRSQAAVSGEKFGIQTTELANGSRIPTVFSSQPEQFSHESSTLGHGLFTAALLEALRSHQCSTLANLEDFLKERLPELCDHHDRPPQDPVLAVSSPDQLYQVTTPVDWAEMEAWNDVESNPFDLEADFFVPPLPDDDVASTNPNLEPNLESAAPINAYRDPFDDLPDELPAPPVPDLELEEPVFSDAEPNLAIDSPQLPTEQRPLAGNSKRSIPSEPAPDQMFWERILFGGGAVLLLLLLGVLFRNWQTFTGQQTANNPSPSVTPKSTQLTTPVGQSPKPTTKPTTKPKPVAVTPAKATASPTAKPTIAPPSQPQNSQALLNEARSLIKPTLASDANKAIERAQRIPPGDPLYDQAQQDIDRWSRDILEIARKRAAEKSFRQAIAAAQLVPKERPQVYAEAQKAIAEWQKRIR